MLDVVAVGLEVGNEPFEKGGVAGWVRGAEVVVGVDESAAEKVAQIRLTMALAK